MKTLKHFLVFFFLFLIFIIIGFTYTDSVSWASCRSRHSVLEFQRQQGYPKGNPGYIIDHICALACGGLDSPKNMQYQSVAEAKAKDKWERKPSGCAKTCNQTNSLPKRTVFNCKPRKYYDH